MTTKNRRRESRFLYVPLPTFRCRGLVGELAKAPKSAETCLTALRIVEYCRNLSKIVVPNRIQQSTTIYDNPQELLGRRSDRLGATKER